MQTDDDHFRIQKSNMHISNYNCMLNLFKIKDMVFPTDLNLLHRNGKQQMNEDKTGLFKINLTPGQQMKDDVGKCQTRKQKVNALGKLLQHSNHKWSQKWQVFYPAGHCSEQWQSAQVNRKN